MVCANIEYDQVEQDAPKSVVVKIAPKEESFQEYSEKLNAFQREIRFYKEVARNVPIRLPVVYYSVDEPPIYSIVMEDLSSFNPGDQIIGMDEDLVLITLETMAVLQSRYWNNSSLDALEWMPTTNSICEDYVENWDPFVKNLGNFVDLDALKSWGKTKKSHRLA